MPARGYARGVLPAVGGFVDLLYRNLNALHDVVTSLGESTGAREEYEAMAPEIASLHHSRRSYGDYLLAARNLGRCAAGSGASGGGAGGTAFAEKNHRRHRACASAGCEEEAGEKATSSSATTSTGSPNPQ